MVSNNLLKILAMLLPEISNDETINQYGHQKKYFNGEYKTYEKYELENWRVSYIRRIFNGLNISSNHIVNDDLYLDIGVGGSGYTVIEAAKIGCRSVGVDISSEGIKKARFFAKNEGESCDFIVCSADKLPFKNDVFSKVSCIAVLEHIPNDKAAIKEISRVTKGGGKIFITVPNTFKRMNPLFWLPYWIQDIKVGHLRHYSAKALIAIFESEGFVLKDLIYYPHFIGVIQKFLCVLFPKMAVSRDSRVWWKLEELDLKMKGIPTALNFNIIMKKVV